MLSKTRHQQLSELISGLKKGLERFTGPKRVSLLLDVAEKDTTPESISAYLYLGDDDLLSISQRSLVTSLAKASRFRPLNFQQVQEKALLPNWRSILEFLPRNRREEELFHAFIFYGSQSRQVHSQVWIGERALTEYQSDSYLEFFYQAETLLRNLFDLPPLALSAARAFHADLEHFSQLALQRTLSTHSFFDEERAGSMLKNLLAISEIREEHAATSGTIVFPSKTTLPTIRLANKARLSEHKRICKLLLSVNAEQDTAQKKVYSPRMYLLANGDEITGVGVKTIPRSAVVVHFQDGKGQILLDTGPKGTKRLIASISRGELHCRPYIPDLSKLSLLFSGRSSKQRRLAATRLEVAVSEIVRYSTERGSGCLVVIDARLSTKEKSILCKEVPGEWFLQPIELGSDSRYLKDMLTFSKGAAKVDGALYLDQKSRLHAMGCILPGSAGKDENPAFGARHRAARRYSKIRKSVLAVTVSENGHIAIFWRGNQV